MTTKYLEINSTYRNRSVWPDPANFEALVAQSGQNSAASALDPVSNAMPIKRWMPNNFQRTTTLTPTVNGTIFTTGIGAGNSPGVAIFNTAANSLHVESDYYKHAVLMSGTSRSRITSYVYLGNDIGKVTLDVPLNLVSGDVVTISDPTDFTTKSVFVPVGSDNANAYANYFLYDETNQQYQTIISYDNVTGVVTTNGSFVGWNLTDVLSIRSQLPISTGLTGGASTPSTVVLSSPVSVPLIGAFVKLNLPFAAGNLPTETRRIIDYNSITNTVVVFPPFTIGVVGVSYELILFSYDNFTPFVYTGTHQMDQLIYEIKLNSLVLPNSVLTSGGSGGTISQYPFVYVELSPLDYTTTNLVASNNPHATKIMFRASYSNYDNVSTANRFVHFVGDEMIQRVKFIVESNFRFKVTLPNGDVFSTVDSETSSPSAPNPDMQLSALFEIKRDLSSYVQRI